MPDDLPPPGTGIVLELTDPAGLRPAPRIPGLTLREIGTDEAALIGRLYRQTWAPLGGGGRGDWSDARWAEELGGPSIRTWVADLGDRPAGFAELGWRGDGDVGIIVLAVVPEAQGRGIGGDLLTRITRLAWDLPAATGAATTRVWLWTVTGEHAHTIPNYQARGFRRGPDLA